MSTEQSVTDGAGQRKTATLRLDTISTKLPNLTLIFNAVSIAVCPSAMCLKYRSALRHLCQVPGACQHYAI